MIFQVRAYGRGDDLIEDYDELDDAMHAASVIDEIYGPAIYYRAKDGKEYVVRCEQVA